MRICDLAKELKTTGKELLGILQARGTNARSVQTTLTPELESFLRAEIKRLYYPDAEPETPAAEESAAPAAPEAAEEPAAEPAAAPAESAEPAPAEEKPAEKEEKTLYIKGHVVVREFAEMLGVKPNILITELMKSGVFASINSKIELKVAAAVGEKYGFSVLHEKDRPAAAVPPPAAVPKSEKRAKAAAAKKQDDRVAGGPGEALPRPPVVTFMGHVDHGKTSLLDYIRKTHVAAGEDGGITQHIGAYQVEREGRSITFLDTPGHEAFTAMRARGANLTDIAVIVIAGDDGIMPQTKEAIQHAQAAKVAMIVAINKCDLPGANPDRVMRQLQQLGLTPEDWGGDLICCKVSAATGEGIDNLLEMILLQADILELKADPKKLATGYVIEARLEAGQGPTANVLVKEGTLKINDAFLSGTTHGKIKAMINDLGAKVRTAGPSAAVKLLGLSSVPEPGQAFEICASDRDARRIAEERIEEARLAGLRAGTEKPAALSLDDLLQAQEGDGKRTLHVILKTDVQGSLEAIKSSIEAIKSEKVAVEVIATGVGGITENDVLLASASKAMILGFHVSKENGAGAAAKRAGVEIRLYAIIYEMLDDVKALMTGLLDPIVKEHTHGTAQIRQIFDMGKRGKVAGCMCQKGKITLRGRVRVRRKDEILYEGKIQSLRRFQNDATEVREGQECGIVLDHFANFSEGDVIESYEVERVLQSL